MPIIIKISTNLGDIRVRLYDETPLHRDNFARLADSGFYDGTLFHRVIKDFMIQGGDPDSIGAPAGRPLGSGGPGYMVDAEINEGLFHKRGALAAARQGDEINPERKSSGSQFYIAWGQVYKEGQLRQLDRQLTHQAQQEEFNRLARERKAEIMDMRRRRDNAALQALQEELTALAMAIPAKELSQAQRDAYTTVGGVPHLDGQYTVFGEVIEGLDVVGKIQETRTGAADRPVEDVVVLRMDKEA
ncbi:MAG: peptidylprolyl isomerase [Bacteroidales bacterium]|nr:peptidylprolyl isomerase [Bacteroidales bacterium]